MGNSKKEKGKKKKLKMETFPERSNEQSIPKIENDSDNENTLSQISNILPLSTKKGWSWKIVFERGGAIANIVIAIATVIALIYAIDSAKSARKSVENTAEIFKLQNMPYLQIGGFKYIGDTLYFNLYNLNQYPAKITNGKIGASNKPDFDMLDMAIGEAIPDSTSISEAIRDPKYSPRPIFDLTIINQYVIKESPVEIPFNDYFSMHTNRNEAPYLTGRIEYNDEVGNTKRRYEFIVRLYGNRSNIKSEFEVNSNLPIKYE